MVDDNGGMTSSMGLYRTDENGQIIIDGLVGTFIITETKTIEATPSTRKPVPRRWLSIPMTPRS